MRKKKGPKYRYSCPKCGSVAVLVNGKWARCKNCNEFRPSESFRGLTFGDKPDDRYNWVTGHIDKAPNADGEV